MNFENKCSKDSLAETKMKKKRRIFATKWEREQQEWKTRK